MPASQPPIYGLKAGLFKVLGHPARVRILELLRDGERNVGELQVALDLDPSGTSQHLSALRKGGLVETRRDGTSVYYRIRDPRALQLLAVAAEVLSAGLAETQALLAELSAESLPAKPARPKSSARRAAPHTDRVE